VVVVGGGETLLCLPVEGLDEKRLAAFRALCAPVSPRLVLTGMRARAIGLEADEPVALELIPDVGATQILALASDVAPDHTFVPEPAGQVASAAIDLVKLAQVLPAVLIAETNAAFTGTVDPPLVKVDADTVARFRSEAMQSLTIAGEARVPLNASMHTRFVVFRSTVSDDPVAVIVGTPDFSKPVPVRIHSACLTGDVFGSRRCDCGDQLKLALARLHELGGGIVLYLPQEGRGVGLANKMRTYKLQDAGLDTVDANTTLGFEDDERDYGVAGRMLQMLGCNRVVLLTNNPAKLDGLSKAGIEIADRMPIETPVNAENRRYLTAKAARAGHQLHHVIEALAEPADGGAEEARLAPSGSD
jgi:GTP cyclohydrolase II